ncbi:MAG: four helix bundle protein [Bacteroidetes bacterium]|nr:four helix bundle protein [Bacteroidota bacterium]MBL0051415.1 four helix bundle protein [Bacteroidota bacterium]
MAGVKNFEELKVWQKAREFNKTLFSVIENSGIKNHYILRDQISRSSISIMSNIAEGFERGGNKEFVQFLYIAKASAGEARAQLYIGLDLLFIEKSQFELLIELAVEVSKMLNGLIKYLKESEIKGYKFMEEEPAYTAVKKK